MSLLSIMQQLTMCRASQHCKHPLFCSLLQWHDFGFCLLRYNYGSCLRVSLLCSEGGGSGGGSGLRGRQKSSWKSGRIVIALCLFYKLWQPTSKKSVKRFYGRRSTRLKHRRIQREMSARQSSAPSAPAHGCKGLVLNPP